MNETIQAFTLPGAPLWKPFATNGAPFTSRRLAQLSAVAEAGTPTVSHLLTSAGRVYDVGRGAFLAGNELKKALREGYPR